MKYLSQRDCVIKTFFDIIYVKYGPKTAQISESDLGKPQNSKTFPFLSKFKFSEIIFE